MSRNDKEFVAGATQRDAALASARCYEGESGLAYGPIIALLRSALARPEKLDRLKTAGSISEKEYTQLRTRLLQ